MDFELTQEMKMLKEMAYKFAVSEIKPFSQECDEHEKYLPEIRIKAAQNGLVGAWIPEQYGGSGAGILGNAIITEEISKVDMGISLNIVASGFGCESILNYGTEEQKQTYLPPICAVKKYVPAPIQNPMLEQMSPVTKPVPSKMATTI
jgi:acyl-CoA dehydrogenase